MVNTKRFLTITLLLQAIHSFSQDTVWISKTGIATGKDSAVRFHVLFKNQTDTQQVRLLRYTRDGALQQELNFFPYSPTPVLEGVYKRYKNDQLVEERFYTKNKLNGTHKTFWPNGQLRRLDNYNNGTWTEGKCYKQDGTDTAWFAYETQASFPGGNDSLRLFMARNFRYPVDARRAEIQGTVRVQFTITKEGKLEDIEIVNKIHPLLDSEAMRIVKRMPQWTPAIQDGENVNMLFILPVVFRLQD